MAFRIVVQPQAMADVDEAVLFMAAKGNPQRAGEWRESVRERILDLAEHPELGLLIPEARRLKRDYRQIHVHSHRVVYFVDDDA